MLGGFIPPICSTNTTFQANGARGNNAQPLTPHYKGDMFLNDTCLFQPEEINEEKILIP